MSPREDKVEKAKLSEQMERYEDMVTIMREVVECASDEQVELTNEERNLLSVAYKNVVGCKRSACRALCSIMLKETDRPEKSEKSEKALKMAKDYKKQVDKELNDTCEEVLKLLDCHLIPMAVMAESKVFYLKMKGDYYRYEAEVAGEEKKAEIVKCSEDAYNRALAVSEGEMCTTHPIRLGLALNFSVFYYEIKNSPDEARKLAKRAFDEAIADLDCSKTESQKDSTLIMQLLHDNLTLWTVDLQCDSEGAEPVEQQIEQTTE